MAITKGFLSRKDEFKPINLIGSLLIWILTAYILYAFFQILREAFRFFTGLQGDRVLLVLTPTENYLYNLFYASIAAALGYLISLRLTLQYSLYKHEWRTKSLIKRTLNIEGFWTWSFLFWFGKLGAILGIWYMMFAMQYEIDFIRDFGFMLIMLPLVLFYSTWPNFSRLVRANKALWFLRVSVVFVLMSVCLAFKNFIDYKEINKNILSLSIEHVFDLKKPNSQSHEIIYRRSIAINIYIVQDTLVREAPAIFFDNIKNRVNLQDIPSAVAIEKDNVGEYDRYYLIANLHIDEAITMGQINPILNELRRVDMRKVNFSTGRKHSRYPSDYPLFKFSGIQKWLPRYFPEFEEFMDSAEQIDLTGKAIRLSESQLYRQGSLKGYNRIEVNVSPDSVTLNGQIIDPIKLGPLVYKFIHKYSPNFVIIFNADDTITYGRYIEILDIFWAQIDRLRNELSIELYDRPFDFWYAMGHEFASIKERFPRNIIEWTTEEQRLNELMKKAGNKH